MFRHLTKKQFQNKRQIIMRQSITNIIITLMAMGACACNRDIPIPQTGLATEKNAELTINVCSSGYMSKAALSAENEAKINNLQLFVFREDGNLDAYANSDTYSDVKLSCTTGKRTIFALVNAPDKSEVTTLGALNQSVSHLADNSLTNFVMTECLEKNITSDQAINLEVSRLAARLSIGKITADFTSPAYRNMELKIKGIYAINVVGDMSYDRTATPSTTPTTWYNKRLYESSDVDALVHERLEDVSIKAGNPYTTPAYFYVYPNSTTLDSQTSPFSARLTRLVVETELGGSTYYYPITISNIECNKKYTVTNLTITRPGSIDPDVPMTSGECTFSISVSDWEEGTTQDYTI